MPRFNYRFFFIAALQFVSGFFLLAGHASAQSETFTSSSLLGPTSQPDSLTLPSFNTGLGLLEGVSITFQFNICPSITADNTTSAPLQFSNLGISAPFKVSGPGALTFNSTLSTKTLSGTAAPGSTSFVPTVGWIYAVEGVKGKNLGFWEDQPGDLINLVVTPGDLLTSPGATTPSGLHINNTALEWENVSVKYTYLTAAAAPEPPGKYLAFIVGSVMAAFIIGRRARLAN